MDHLISVIVPIYNVKKYLRKCLQSIVCQDYQNLEIILVDDGSTDGSAEICKEFSDIDSRIIYLRKINGGVSSARNLGLDVANGEWIGFVDADDYIDKNMYSDLAIEIDMTDKKIICCAVTVEDLKGNVLPHLNSSMVPVSSMDLSQEETLKQYLNPLDRLVYWSPWDKIIHKSILCDKRFEEGRKYAEDFDFCLNCILASDGIRYSPISSYHYIVRPGSAITGKKFSSSSFDGVYFSGKALSSVMDLNFDDQIVRYAKVNLTISALRTIKEYYKERPDKNKYKTEIERCFKIIKQNRKDVWDLFNVKTKILYFLARTMPLSFKYI